MKRVRFDDIALAINKIRNEFTKFPFHTLEKYVQDKALLFTTNMPDSAEKMSCGTAEGVYSTVDFGIEVGETQMDSVWQSFRAIQSTGPLVNSEFYPGWLTNWQEDNQRRDADRAVNVLK